MEIVGEPPDPVAQDIQRLTRLDTRILVDDGIQSAVEKQLARAVCHFVADENDAPLASAFLQRPSYARVACADVLDCLQIGVSVEQGRGFHVSSIRVIPHFANFKHLQRG